MRSFKTAAVVLGLALLAGSVASADKPETIKLFNGKDLAGWTHFLTEADAKLEDAWSVKDGVIVCKGTPGGYLATKDMYESFILVVEWRWPAKPGNSGVLMRITGDPKMLPNCCEAQLKSGDAGAMYGFQGFKLAGDKSRLFANPNAVGGLTGLRKAAANEKEAGEWNKFEITAKGDTVTIILNGKEVNKATGVDVRAGQIGLQSEGGEIHFRTVTITPLKK